MKFFRLTKQNVNFCTDKGDIYLESISPEQFRQLKDLLNVNDLTQSKVFAILSIIDTATIERNLDDRFEMRAGSVYLKGVNVSVPECIIERMNIEDDIEYLVKFWKLAALNPDPAVRDNIFWFLETHDFEITQEGFIVAYRNANSTTTPGLFTDAHSGTTKIRIGEQVSLDRSLCDFNQNNTCSSGLHVASKNWLSNNYFGDTGLMCIVNPIDVVAVPPQDSYGKMRCCSYLPIGFVDYNDDGTIKSETSIDDYQYELDVNLLAMLNMLYNSPNLSCVEDGTLKILDTKSATDYRELLDVARQTISNRLN